MCCTCTRIGLDYNNVGAITDGKEYQLDPGHPDVQRHIFDVAMEIVSRYEVDGLCFDYLRYPGRDWGYNPVSVARFNRIYGETGQPSSSNTNWAQFRRDQVTALLRKIYLSATAIKPSIKISAAAVAWSPVPKDDQEWQVRSGAYSYVFQDWCGWMKEGILDIAMPMVYLNHLSPANKDLFSNWVKFAAAHSEGRHVVISPACFLNTIESTVGQIRLARGSGDLMTDGVCLYSYASFSKERVPRHFLVTALTKSNRLEKDASSVFREPVSTPLMPWKSNPSSGHLKGFVCSELGTNALDGARVVLKGVQTRTTTTDATGFYGFVGVPPGNYTLEASFPSHRSSSAPVNVSVGKVATADVCLSN